MTPSYKISRRALGLHYTCIAQLNVYTLISVITFALQLCYKPLDILH